MNRLKSLFPERLENIDSVNIPVNKVIDDYSSKILNQHIDNVITVIKTQVDDILKVINYKYNIADTFVQSMLIAMIDQIQKRGKKKKVSSILKDAVTSVKPMDLVNALAFLYTFIVYQVMNRKKVDKMVTQAAGDSYATWKFPGCQRVPLTYFLANKSANKSTQRGLTFVFTLLQEFGDFNAIMGIMDWWESFKKKDYIEFRMLSIGAEETKQLSYLTKCVMKHGLCNAVHALLRDKYDSSKYYPKFEEHTLYIPNLFNPKVFSSRVEQSSMSDRVNLIIKLLGTIISHMSVKTSLVVSKTISNAVYTMDKPLEILNDVFGMNAGDNSNAFGKLNLQVVLIYVKIMSCVIILNIKDNTQDSLKMFLHAQCGFLKEFQMGGETNPNVGVSLIQFIKSILVNHIHFTRQKGKYFDSPFFKHSDNVDVFFNANEDFHNVNYSKDSKELQREFNKVLGYIEGKDPSFKTLLVLYANVCNFIILISSNQLNPESGFLEFKKGAKNKNKIFYKDYIDINNEDDHRARMLRFYIATLYFEDIPQRLRITYRNRLVNIVFRNAVKRFAFMAFPKMVVGKVPQLVGKVFRK